VGLDNYPVLNRDYGDRYFGGESVQQTMLALAFRDLGYEVSMVVLDYGQPDGEILEGIRVWKTYREDSGIPILRFVHPRASSIFSALTRADSDIYFQSCSAAMTGFVAWHAKRNERAFIFRVASDGDCVSDLPLIRYDRDRAIYRYGLKRADLVAAQSYHQQTLLAKSFDQSSTVVNMAVGIPEITEKGHSEFDVLWVNNLRPLKRPHQVLRLAERLPQYRFAMIGGAVPGSEDLYQDVVREARSISNLDVLGPVPFHEAAEYFLRARVFINTSEIEGFPNSMLQAWAAGLPVISYFDPDGLNEKLKLGHCPIDIDDMGQSIKRFLENDVLREETGGRARQYVATNHAPTAVAKRYIEALGVKSTGGMDVIPRDRPKRA
jgi:glycosyltransferase involved in cell wall biosynthesis